MTNDSYVEQLTPLDLPMPRTYIRVLLGFETAIATPALPWLSGEVFPATSIQHKAALEIRSNAGHTPTLVDKGSIAASYTAFMINDALSATGALVSAAGLFRFADQGVGLCVWLHHNAVDATRFTEIVQLDLVSLSEGLFASHHRYSKVPPAMPTGFPPCTSKLLKVSIHQINVLKKTLRYYMSNAPTTNLLLCALIWTTITRVRASRSPVIAGETSRLVTVVNGRKRISENLSVPENPYSGNDMLYSLRSSSVGVLATSDEEAMRSLAEICVRISQSQSYTKINSRHIAEVYRLVDCMEDYKSLFVDWDLFGSRDLTITSWADLDLYEMDFGPMLGRPKFARFPCMEADGVAIILLRQRDLSEEKLKVMAMLHKDDMDSLENDRM
ncbi:hypothetical protein BDV39DRAFT_195780 [Aspergillus sergii]|uniref:Transferase family-domain-containing protein n=1 Tax=Aspergillus sergii TaxID=1034303 RepID=A0A5N6WRT0_9EURO|nr:hypothetical protein BDV39DRAFT_195780 [Aspergillus sergii]